MRKSKNKQLKICFTMMISSNFMPKFHLVYHCLKKKSTRLGSRLLNTVQKLINLKNVKAHIVGGVKDWIAGKTTKRIGLSSIVLTIDLKLQKEFMFISWMVINQSATGKEILIKMNLLILIKQSSAGSLSRLIKQLVKQTKITKQE